MEILNPVTFADIFNAFLVEALKLAVVGAFGLLVPILVRVLQRVGIQLDQDRQNRLNSAAVLIAAEVEEWAAAKLKANQVVSSGDKLEKAIVGVLDKIPGISEAEARAAVLAALPQIGLGAAAGLKELGKGLVTPGS